MGDWESVFREIDDDYLIGISNKGIVKRAYKDMETTSCSFLDSDLKDKALQDFSAGDAIAVKVGEETVQVRMPLGESTCSCPSRSICRHVMLGILSLQKMAAATDTKSANLQTVAAETAEKEAEVEITEITEKGTTTKEPTVKEIAEKEAIVKETAESETTAKEVANFTKSDNTMVEKVLQQIAEYSIEKLCKSLGIRKLQQIIGNAKAGNRPQISYTSVVTVQPVAQAMTVRLLYPLEYSTCTCHKKAFCAHKAEAVLWCKLEAGQIDVDALEQSQNKSAAYDMEQIGDTVQQMKTFLEELMDTGLSRTPQDALDHMERFATICHNAKLPNFENDWRRLQDSYSKYNKRVASLSVQTLLRQFIAFYRQVEQLGKAQNALEVSRLAGAFRAEYTSVLDLDLVGIAAWHFVSRSGYEGETIYFLEEKTKEWYTYTQARPVYYDNDNAANPAAQRYVQETPWGLSIPFRELAFWHIRLEQAKCDSRGRLSSSKETKGQLVQDRRADKTKLTADFVGRWYYQDFARLFEEQFEEQTKIQEKNNLTKLVFLNPASCEPAVFLETQQKLSMNLYDAAGKAVVVEVVYSRDEAEGIQYLEKITNTNLPCFFGKIYLRDGRIRMYPIAVFDKDELESNRKR